MLYNLLVPLADSIPLFNLFRYLTFRSGGAVITALTIAFLIGPAVIEWLRSRKGEGQPIRSDGPEGHLLTKKGTPTRGGVLILIQPTNATLPWAEPTNSKIWFVLLGVWKRGGEGKRGDRRVDIGG